MFSWGYVKHVNEFADFEIPGAMFSDIFLDLPKLYDDMVSMSTIENLDQLVTSLSDVVSLDFVAIDDKEGFESL